MADDHTHIWPPRPPAPLCQILKPSPWQVKARELRKQSQQTSRTIGYNEQEMTDWNEWRAARKAKAAREKDSFARHEHKTPVSEVSSPEAAQTQQGHQLFVRAQDLRITREMPALTKKVSQPDPMDDNLPTSSREQSLRVNWERIPTGRLPAPPSLGDTFEMDEYFQLHDEEE